MCLISSPFESENDASLVNKLKLIITCRSEISQYCSYSCTDCFLTSVPLSLLLNELLTNPLVTVKYSNIVEIVAAVDLVDFNPRF